MVFIFCLRCLSFMMPDWLKLVCFFLSCPRRFGPVSFFYFSSLFFFFIHFNKCHSNTFSMPTRSPMSREIIPKFITISIIFYSKILPEYFIAIAMPLPTTKQLYTKYSIIYDYRCFNAAIRRRNWCMHCISVCVPVC